jgi:AcrR family transcriptional regulator
MAQRLSARREEIVDIAKRLFATRGYAATSMRDIADASGLLAGSLYSHFRSKSQILELVLLPFYDELVPAQREVVALDASGVERVERMLRVVFVRCANHVDAMTILHYDWPNISGNAELAEVLEQSTETLDLWYQVLTAGVEDGSLRPDVDADAAMRVITSAIHAVLDRQRYGPRQDLIGELGQDVLIDELLLIVIDGLRAP